jgi:O-antigen ligase
VKWGPAILVAAIVLGWAMTNLPPLVLAAVGLMGVVWMGPAFLRRSQQALALSVFVLLIAGTDFRTRDPYESVQVAVDLQVAFELAVYFVLFLAAVRASYRVPREHLRFYSIEWALMAYLLLAAFSVVWTPITAYTATRAIQLGILLLLAYVSVRVLGPERTIRAVAVSVVAYVLIFVLIAAPMKGGDWASGARLSWFAVHPIQVGTYAATGALLLIANLQYGEPSNRHLGLKWLLLCFLIAVVVMTHSRGPILAFAVAATTIVLVHYAPTVAATAAIAIFVLLALAAYNTASGIGGVLDLAAASDNAVLAFLFRGQTAEEFATLTGRMELWEAMSIAFLEHPILGHGYQAARIVGMRILPWAGEAHNALAQSLLDLGLVGTAILLFATLRALAGSYVATMGPRTSTTPYHVAILSLLMYLLVNSIVTASFAGPPGYEPFVLFVCIIAGEQLRDIDRLPVGPTR